MAMSNPPLFGQRGSLDPRSQGGEEDDDPVLGLARSVRSQDPFEGIFRARQAKQDDLRNLAPAPGPRSAEPIPRVGSRHDDDDDYDERRDDQGRHHDDYDDRYDDRREAVSWDQPREEEQDWDDRAPQRSQPQQSASRRAYADEQDYDDDGYEDDGSAEPTKGHRTALRVGERVEEPKQRSGLAGLFGKKKAEPAPPPAPAAPAQEEWHDDREEYDDDEYDDRHDPRYARAADTQAADEDEEYDDEDYYDDEDEPVAARRRRGGGLIVAAVVCIGVVGAGAFGYWQLTSPQSGEGPEVVSADTSPTKVIPITEGTPDAPREAVRERFTETAQEPVQTPPGDPDAADSANPLQPKLVKTYSVRPPEGQFAQDKPGLIPDAAQPFAGMGGGSIERAGSIEQSTLRTATPTASTPTPPTGEAPLPPGTWMVQVLAGPSEEAARNDFQALQQKHPGILGGKEPHIQKTARLYRVRLPMEDKEAAVQLCTNLKAKSVDCLVRNN